MQRNAVIIGAGIGGLATAVALQRVGWEVEVYERASTLREVGAGLSLWQNALVALDRIGLLGQLKAMGVEGQKGAIRTPAGDVLVEMQAGGLDTTSGVILLLHRAELHDVLYRAAGPENVHLGARCLGLEQDGGSVSARFEDGRTARGDALIGADGLRSMVRASLFGPTAPRYGGYTTWRGVATYDHAKLTPGETWGRGRRFGQWGMTGGRVYWYATETAPAGGEDPVGSRKRKLLELFRGWHAPVEALIEATDESAILRSDVFDRPALSRWSIGRATVLGDAAHPMTPDMGQGACQAIEDAVVLAAALKEAREVEQGLRAYEARRIPRTSRVVRESRRAGWMAQWSNPLACQLRSAVMRTRFAARSQARQLAWMITPVV